MVYLSFFLLLSLKYLREDKVLSFLTGHCPHKQREFIHQILEAGYRLAFVSILIVFLSILS